MAAAETSVISRLPLPISSFIGRETELDTLHQILASGARLITLVGPGGVGRTRLALEVCAREATLYPHGACFVSLEAISEAEHVLPEIARGLSVELSGTATPLEDLVSALTGKRLLLGVDNWEHLIEAAVQIVPLLAACPDLQIIATSREALRLRGEQVIWVEPLQLPQGDAGKRLEATRESQAVQLFVERARAVRPGFELDGRNMAAVTEICSLVDGLPLAIELAAALLRLFSPEALLARMQSSGNFAGRSGSVNLLVGGPRDLPARQQTIRSTIDWSYSLLDTEEQSVFRRMAVFADGCDLEAAEAVCEAESAGRRPILDTLITLTDKSLLRLQRIDGEPRFGMLQTIREYTSLQLQAADELNEISRRHASYYNNLVESAVQGLNGPDVHVWSGRLDIEHDNFRTALGWSLDHDELATAFHIGGNLWRFWDSRGLYSEGIQWLKRILATEGNVSLLDRANVLNGAGGLALKLSDDDSAKWYLTEALTVRKEAGDMPGVSGSLHNLAMLAINQNDYKTALSRIEESLNVDRDLGDRAGVASGTLVLAWILTVERQYESACTHTLQALATFQELNITPMIAHSLEMLGNISFWQEDYDQAHEYVSKGQALFQSLGFASAALNVNHSLGNIALSQQRVLEAEELFTELLKGKMETGDKTGIFGALDGLACVAVARSAPLRAAQLWGASEAARKTNGVPRPDSEQEFCERYITTTRAQLKEREFLSAYQAGEAMNLEHAIRFALQPYTNENSKPALKTARPTYPAGLTAREVDVLRLVAKGLSDNEVAEQLVLSPRTVNAHLTSIYSKLDVNSRVAATRFAIENKLVD